MTSGQRMADGRVVRCALGLLPQLAQVQSVTRATGRTGIQKRWMTSQLRTPIASRGCLQTVHQTFRTAERLGKNL